MLQKWVKRVFNAKGVDMIFYQQGDVILKECAKPKDITILKTDLLHKGQNHHHRLNGKFRIGVSSDGTKYVHSKGSILTHEEHLDINLPEAFYEFSVVMEYDHWLEESRQVID